jgi:hypothetical protein
MCTYVLASAPHYPVHRQVVREDDPTFREAAARIQFRSEVKARSFGSITAIGLRLAISPIGKGSIRFAPELPIMTAEKIQASGFTPFFRYTRR